MGIVKIDTIRHCDQHSPAEVLWDWTHHGGCPVCAELRDVRDEAEGAASELTEAESKIEDLEEEIARLERKKSVSDDEIGRHGALIPKKGG